MPKNRYAQRKTILRWIMVCQKVPKSYFQSQFSMSKIDGIFSKKNHFRISIWETFFCKKTSFSNFNFWTTLYSKIMPNFWRTDIHCIQKIQLFPLNKLIFVPKILLFGTHHFWNSTNELTLNGPTSDHQHLFQSYLNVLTYLIRFVNTRPYGLWN